MSDLQPYVIEIYQGATLFREIAVLNSDRTALDVSSTTKSVTMSDGIDDVDVTVSQGDANNLIEIRADGIDTATWPPGTYTLLVWLDWGAVDIEDEVIFAAKVVVRSAV